MSPIIKSAVAALAVATFALALVALGQSKPRSANAQTPTSRSLPLELDRKIALSLNSHAVEWRSNTYYLVRLGSIQFQLDKSTGHLKAEIEAGVTSFDDVNYDVSAAVFDGGGALLGTARTECKVERLWLGNVLFTQPKLTLDFGKSLDYSDAASFMVSISRCNVLTPDQWQK